MLHQICEREVHLGACLGIAELLAIEVGDQRQVHPTLLPGVTEFVRGHREGGERGGGFTVEEAEALLQLGRDQRAEGHVVADEDQANVLQRLVLGGALGHVAEDHADLGFEVEAPRWIGQRDGLGRIQEHAAAALVDEGIGLEGGRRLSIAGPSHQANMVEVGGAVDPLVGPGQGRSRHRGVEGLATASLQRFEGRAQAGFTPIPVVEGCLQRRSDGCRGRPAAAITRNHPQLLSPPLHYRSRFSTTDLATARSIRVMDGAPACPSSVVGTRNDCGQGRFFRCFFFCAIATYVVRFGISGRNFCAWSRSSSASL